MLCVYVCATGVRGECGEPGEVRAGDQVPTATVSLSRRYLGDRRGEPTSSLVPNSLASCHVSNFSRLYRTDGIFFGRCWLSQVSKTLKATLTSLLDTMCDSDSNPAPDLTSSLSHELPGVGTALKMTLAKRRANQQETESFYFTVRWWICQLGFCSCIWLSDLCSVIFKDNVK